MNSLQQVQQRSRTLWCSQTIKLAVVSPSLERSEFAVDWTAVTQPDGSAVGHVLYECSLSGSVWVWSWASSRCGRPTMVCNVCWDWTLTPTPVTLDVKLIAQHTHHTFVPEMCGNDFRVSIPSRSHDFVPDPFPALGNLRLCSNSHLFLKTNPNSLTFPFPLKQEEFQQTLIVVHGEEWFSLEWAHKITHYYSML